MKSYRAYNLILLAILLLSLATLLAPGPVQAAIFDVPCIAETPDALVNAIHDANITPGHDIIRLEADCTFYLYTVQSVDPQNGPNGLPIITEALTIEGNGARLVRAVEGSEQFRLMMTGLDVPLAIRDLMLSNGFAPEFDDRQMAGGAIYAGGPLSLENVHLAGNRANSSGGGVYSRGSLVTVTDSFFEENEARHGNGGGLLAWGHVIIRNSQFITNQAFGRGGAVANVRLLIPTSVQVHDSTFEDNHATSTSGQGGALDVQHSLVVSGSRVYANSAPYGAAVHMGDGSASIASTTFQANTAIGSGGAIYALNTALILQQSILEENNGGFPGGALYLEARDASTSRIENNLFAADASEDDSATLFVAGTTSQSAGVNILHNTIVYGRDGVKIAVDVDPGNDVLVANNIIAGYDIGIDNSNATVRAGYNLFYHIATGIHRGNILPYEGGNNLQVNPGFVDVDTGNYQLRGTSQAVDSAVDVGVNIDLLGVFRPQEAGLDRGAYEFVNLNRAPIAVDDAYSTTVGTRLVGEPGVLANDNDPDGDALRANIVAYPAHAGLFVLNGNGAFTYVPEEGYVGQDSFTYQAVDDLDSSNEATVTINIEAANTPPIAVDDTYEASVNSVLTIAAPGLLDNDQDVDGDALVAVLESAPSNGAVTIEEDGSFTYLPDEDYAGSDSFTYTTSDGSDSSNAATVNILVVAEEVNLSPVAVGDAYTTTYNAILTISSPGVLLNDSDADDDPLTVLLLSPTLHGTLTLQDDGSFTYVPDVGFSGADNFSYQAFDGEHGSNPVTVHIEVLANTFTYHLFLPAIYGRDG